MIDSGRFFKTLSLLPIYKISDTIVLGYQGKHIIQGENVKEPLCFNSLFNKPIPKYTPVINTPHNPVRVTLFGVIRLYVWGVFDGVRDMDLDQKNRKRLTPTVAGAR